MVRTPAKSLKIASPRRPNGLINLDVGAMSDGPSLHLSNTPRFKKWHVPLDKDPVPRLPSPPKFTRLNAHAAEVEKLRADLIEAREQNHALSESNKRLFAQLQKLQAQLARQDTGRSVVGLKTIKSLSAGRGAAETTSAAATGPRRSMSTRSQGLAAPAIVSTATAVAAGKQDPAPAGANNNKVEEDCDADLSKVSTMLSMHSGGQENEDQRASLNARSKIPLLKVTPPDPSRSPLSDATNRSPKARPTLSTGPKRRSSASPRASLGVSASPRSSIRATSIPRRDRAIGTAR